MLTDARFLAGALVLAAALPAAASAQCIRAGGPIDEVRCELAVVKADRAALQERYDRVMTAAQLGAAELIAGKDRETKLAEWFRAWFGGDHAM